jgi:hypothetical protein
VRPCWPILPKPDLLNDPARRNGVNGYAMLGPVKVGAGVGRMDNHGNAAVARDGG